MGHWEVKSEGKRGGEFVVEGRRCLRAGSFYENVCGERRVLDQKCIMSKGAERLLYKV